MINLLDTGCLDVQYIYLYNVYPELNRILHFSQTKGTKTGAEKKM